MIKLKDLLIEGGAQSLHSMLGSPKWHDQDGYMINAHGWEVKSSFKVTVATGKMVPSNVYYGSSRVSKDPGRVETARSGDMLIHMGSDFLVSEKRKKAWKILYLGPERSLGGAVPNQAPRTVIPKSSVNYIGNADRTFLEYDKWKSWVVAR